MLPQRRVAIRLGNCNNDLIDGPANLNLNNEASNANWNNGVGLILLLGMYRTSSIYVNAPYLPKPLAVEKRIADDYS